MAAPVDFTGTWKLESSSPNFEDMLKAMNIGLIMRKTIKNLSPEVTIKQDGNEFHIVTKTRIRSQESKFKVGEEFERKHMLEDGKMQKVLITWEGDSLVTTVLDDDNTPVITRTIEDGKMKVKQKKGDLEVFRTFVKVN